MGTENRQKIQKFVFLVISIAIMVSLPTLLSPKPFTIKNFGVNDVTQLLTLLLFISLLMERFIEVFITTWRGSNVKESEYKSQTQKIALWSSFILGIITSAIGIRALETFVNVEGFPNYHILAFRWLDVFLTGGLIAGGSDGIHKLTKVFLDFLEATSTQIRNKTS